MQKFFSKGFTLIEVLLVIAILAILAAVVIVAINPARQLATARDTQRVSDVYSILSAIHQYAVNNEGAFPPVITATSSEICQTGNVTCINMYDLSVLTDNQVYMVSIPQDPKCPFDSAYCSDGGTGYFVGKTAGGRIRVSAPGVELANDISLTR